MRPVARQFVPFDEATIDAEFDELARSSVQDETALLRCMERYETCGRDGPSPALIKPFSEGFKELRHLKQNYAGRLLFYDRPRERGTDDVLIQLRVFRKEGQDTPMRERRTAEARMKAHKKSQGDA